MSFFKLPFAKTAGHKKYQLCSITASEGEMILGDVLLIKCCFSNVFATFFLFQEVFYYY
jgi:hypothetical protein